jgi:protein-L-isoaspartate(D-aspartate) O-methyltransferase
MTQLLDPKPTERILEIGTGSGYQTAILAELAGEVYSIEIVEDLAKPTAETLKRLGYTNIHFAIADGSRGWPEAAPFDAIMGTCAPDDVPQALIDQLANGGRMVIPVGQAKRQQIVVLRKVNGRLARSAVLPVQFVPMVERG